MLECRPFLDQVVFEELEPASLRKHRGLLIQGSILKAKREVACHAIAFCDLRPVTGGNDSALFGSQEKEPMQESFLVAYGHQISRKRPGPKDPYRREDDRK